MKQIKKILIANRGEIAVRIMRTCRQMGIETVAIYSQDDANALHKETADYAAFLEGNTLQGTYLNIDQIIAVAKQNNVDAIHPGYGFLSERAPFAKACDEAGIRFIGPPASAIELMGDKVASRKFAEEHNIPLLKGITGSTEELLAQKDQLQFPVMIKAAAGGGGKGMRVVMNESDFDDALEATAREALSYFGNDEVFIERYIQAPRHIEVQVLGDQHGNLLHLFERECTIQRRHQKIIEEAPSVSLSEEQRMAIGETAVELAKACGYYSAGTVEFIVDEEMNFYFMEMNTRIQVEHPVTENIVGKDLVEQQIRVAQGEELAFSQEDVFLEGHSTECRIYAEDPANDFQPSPGLITYYSEPAYRDMLRIDSSLDRPQEISGSFDPMISKLVTWAPTREEAIDSCVEALNDYIIEGITTNIDYLKMILLDEQYKENDITTNYCKQRTEDLFEQYNTVKSTIDERVLLLAGLTYDLLGEQKYSVWEEIGFYRMVPTILVLYNGQEFTVFVERVTNDKFQYKIGDQQFLIETIRWNKAIKTIQFYYEQEQYEFQVHQTKSNQFLVQYEQFNFSFTRKDVLDETKEYAASASTGELGDAIVSPIPGTVVKVIVKEGEEVQENQPLIIVEAMKMENTLTAPRSGVVESIHFSAGDKVNANEQLIQLKKENE